MSKTVIALTLFLLASIALAEITSAQIQTILDEHNRLRTTVPGSNILKLLWDPLLQRVATNYLAKLTANNAAGFSHNANRTADYKALGGKGYVGENWYSGSPDKTGQTLGASNSWVDFVWPTAWGGNGCSERQNCQTLGKGTNYPYEDNSVCFPSASCTGAISNGHFTQVVWALTQYVGCAYDTKWGTLCDYYPGGNMQGASVYLVDTAGCTSSPCTTSGKATASRCPTGYTDDSNGLCVSGTVTTPTPVNCVGSWQVSSTCSVTCGSGVQNIVYRITTPAANGGASCPSTDGATSTQSCNSGACPPVDCVGSWQVSSTCSVSCGPGVQNLVYRITTPAANGGASCSSTDGATSTQSCNSGACPSPVNCVGDWQVSMACSVSCGTGVQTDIYRISTPAANGGASCSDADGVTRDVSCNPGTCPPPTSCQPVDGGQCASECVALSDGTNALSACCTSTGVRVCTCQNQ